MRAGVTGADGLLGTTLVPLWRRAGAEVVGWTLEDFDVTDGAATRRAILDAKPDVVIHAAAYTAVDRAESEPDVALAVNRDGTANVCAACTELGARLVYLSTDYVFDGAARAPIPPDAPRAPLGAYARGKAAGEAAVEASGSPWMIVRTEWVFGPGGANFVDTVRRAAAEGRALEVVDDQVGAPTSTRLVSEGLWGPGAAPRGGPLASGGGGRRVVVRGRARDLCRRGGGPGARRSLQHRAGRPRRAAAGVLGAGLRRHGRRARAAAAALGATRDGVRAHRPGPRARRHRGRDLT